jgi:hypothetical protein
MSLKEQFQRLAGSRQYATVADPELGDVRLQSLTEREWATMNAWFRDPAGEMIPDRIAYDKPKLLSLCIVDAEGTREFSDSLEDLNVIANLPLSRVMPLYRAAWELNVPALPKN